MDSRPLNLYAVTAYSLTGLYAARTGARARYLTFLAAKDANYDARWERITRCRRVERGVSFREGYVSHYDEPLLYARHGMSVDFS